MSRKGRLGLGLGLLAAVAAVLVLLLSNSPLRPGQAATPTAQAPVTRSSLELLALPDAGQEPLLQALDGARESIRLKAYLLSDDAVLAALQRAAGRGVAVRVLLEPEPFGGGDSNRLAAEKLRSSGVEVRNAPAAFRFSHEKSLVIDERRAWVMTFNLTPSSFHQNREYGAIVDDPELVEEIIQVFEADWERRQPELSQPRLIWSPENSRQRLTELLDEAQASLDLEQPSLLDDGLIERLIAAAQRGAAVRVITPAVLDPGEPEYEPLSRLVAGGVAVRFLDEPYVHAKAILVDGRLAFVGSQNFTSVSLDHNRELGIAFDDAAAVNRLASYFLQDWNLAQPWTGPQPTPTLPASGVVPWQRAGEYVGQRITVEGDIIETYNSGKVAFLNFSEDRDDFTLVIFAEDFGRFTEPPEELYYQKRVQATGRVQLYKGRPEMVLQGPDQIKILADLTPASVSSAATLPPGGIVGWQDAGQYIGQKITVEGDVVRTYNSGRVAFLNFAEDYEGTLSVVIFAADFTKWPQPPDQLYLGQRIRVTGKVKEYQGAPEIVVEKPDQIEVVGPAQATVSPTATPRPVISWQEAAAHEGQEVTVQGTVVDSYKSDKVIFLNFSRNRDDFKVVIFARNWERWTQAPDELYLGRAIRVTGEIQLYQGRPEIVVNGPAQIQVVE